MFKCIAELDLGPQAATTSTANTMHEMLREVLAAGASCVVLKDELVSDRGNLSLWDEVNTKRAVNDSELKKLERIARKGYHLAVVVTDVGKVLGRLESRGYERCTETSIGSASLIGVWTVWLNQHFPVVQGALVFGHDFEPIFIFENLSRKH